MHIYIYITVPFKKKKKWSKIIKIKEINIKRNGDDRMYNQEKEKKQRKGIKNT